MPYTPLNGGVPWVIDEPWAYQDANEVQENFEDHEDRIADLEGGDSDAITGANGEIWERAQITESITLSTSGAVTDSVANLLPANSLIEAVVARITTTIGTASNWALGDAAESDRFATAHSTLTAGTTRVGLEQHRPQTVGSPAPNGPVQTAAAKLRITCTGTPSAGVIRVTVFYQKFTAPTS